MQWICGVWKEVLSLPDFLLDTIPQKVIPMAEVVKKADIVGKTDLVNLVAAQVEDLKLSKVAIDEVINASLEAIKTIVATGKKVTIVGFGTFEASQRSARTGRNPQTGKEIKIAAATVPRFRAGKGFKDAVNK
jgi:DNA-binding protein HU-beta